MENLTTYEQFKTNLAIALRDHIPGIAAGLTDSAVAYWNGHKVIYVYLRHDGSGRLDNEFELDERLFDQWYTELHSWLTDPHFKVL